MKSLSLLLGAVSVASTLAADDLLANAAPKAPVVELDASTKPCSAQNVLDNCLTQQKQVLAMCSYSDWECKCQAQKSIAGCFGNCPSDQARPSHEGQVGVFCDAAKRVKEEEDKSKSKTSKPTPTKAHQPNPVDDELKPTHDNRRNRKSTKPHMSDSELSVDNAAAGTLSYLPALALILVACI
ncbi:hypothetical protein GGF46_002443 [Coemansia sp. RSA 552]|nr:hypothetical protein GGF46_002443 [Coemansia sp. RSA 552]